jgi:putative Ca2+/H+ antiporter (TMEM165/GDT1 family)
MIIVSEIGDKTFLIAALMAMSHPRLPIFIAAFLSLVVMTLLSASIGHLVQDAIGRKWTNIAASILFLGFGIRMLLDGYRMPEGNESVKEEIMQVEQELQDKGPVDEEKGQTGEPQTVIEASYITRFIVGVQNLLALLCNPVFAQTFIMTFLGEWGDRSQIATIALAARQVKYCNRFTYSRIFGGLL